MRLLANFGFDSSFILQEYADEAKGIRKNINLLIKQYPGLTRNEALYMSLKETNECFDLLKELAPSDNSFGEIPR